MTRPSCTCHSRVTVQDTVPLSSSPAAPKAVSYDHVGTFYHAAEDDGSHCSLMGDSTASSYHGHLHVTDDVSNPVVMAQAVSISKDDSNENIPALDLSSETVHAVPELSLAIDEQNSTQDMPTCVRRRKQLPVSRPYPPVVPEAVACPVETVPTRCMYDSRNRPQFLSATVVRNTTSEKFGITFLCYPNQGRKHSFLSRRKSKDVVNKFPQISLLHDQGLLSQAPFCVGDLLVSINKQSCQGISPAALTSLLSNLTGTITLVVQHPGGDPSLVESFLLKPTATRKAGIALYYSPELNCLRVQQVRGLLADGLLQEDDRIVAINHIPCKHWDAHAAAEQISKSYSWVSMVARKDRDAGVVLSVQDHTPLPKRKERA